MTDKVLSWEEFSNAVRTLGRSMKPTQRIILRRLVDDANATRAQLKGVENLREQIATAEEAVQVTFMMLEESQANGNRFQDGLHEVQDNLETTQVREQALVDALQDLWDDLPQSAFDMMNGEVRDKVVALLAQRQERSKDGGTEI